MWIRPATLWTAQLLRSRPSTPIRGDGKISLREAILAANATANGSGGPDRIYFNIPGSGVQTIASTSTLPNITDAVIIDGYTQTGSSANRLAIGNDAVLTIELNGSQAGSGKSGLTLASGSSGSTIRGLIINRFSNTGIRTLFRITILSLEISSARFTEQPGKYIRHIH